MYERVKKFNDIASNSPPKDGDYEKFWDFVRLQSALIVEESLELSNAVLNRDLENLVKEWCDVEYVSKGMRYALDNVGIDTTEAIDKVCKNNELKYTSSLDFAQKSKDYVESQGSPSYVEKSFYKGVEYFTVRRSKDGKIMKLIDYESPDIRSTIPDNTFNNLNGIKDDSSPCF